MDPLLQNFFDCTYISENCAILDIQEARDIYKFIEKFDQGHQSVMLTENGIFKGLVEQNSFRENLFKRKVLVFPNFWLEYNEDEYNIKMRAIDIFLRSSLREIPVLKDGYIVSVVVNSLSIGASQKLNAVEFPPVYWNLIGQELAERLFEHKKILISSNYGSLEGFKDRFEPIAEVIDTYNEVNWSKYENSQYDLFLCGSQVFIGGGGMIKHQYCLLVISMLICLQQKFLII